MEGDIELPQYAQVVGQFDQLVTRLTHEIVPSDPINWAIDELVALPGSAETTAYGRSGSRDAVYQVAQGYLTIGQALESGSPIPFSPPVREMAERMQSVLNGRVRALVFETADSEATVTAHPAPGPHRRVIETLGAVTGRIQTVTNRRGLRFTLYDVVHDRAVSCYLAEDREEVMLGAWGKFAVVEGIVRRNPETGRPVSIRQIRGVTVRPDGPPNAYLDARGAVTGPFLMSSEEAVRRVRDAQ
jgi:hypothetical protein